MKRQIILLVMLLVMKVHAPIVGNLGTQLAEHFKALLENNPEHIQEGDIGDFCKHYPHEVLQARFNALLVFRGFLEGKNSYALSSLVYEFAEKHRKSARYLLEDRLGYAKFAAELAKSERAV